MNPGWIVGALLVFLIPGTYGILLVAQPVKMTGWISRYYRRFGRFGEFLASFMNPALTRIMGVLFIAMGVAWVVVVFGPFVFGWRAA